MSRIVAMALVLGWLFPHACFAQNANPARGVTETHQKHFWLPVRLKDETAASSLTLLRLYVSMDKGKNWKIASELDAKGRSFYFKAQSYGEYWFIVQTMDRDGKMTPNDLTQAPILKVAVKKKAPGTGKTKEQAK